MFNVSKSAPPAGPFAYNAPVVVALVRNDFYDKCYLCEEKTPRHLEVEHFYPQAFCQHLINDWQNLLCICGKCNKLRPKTINTINENEVLNCCVDDVENSITLRFDEKTSSLQIAANDVSVKARNTVYLLEKIHNGKNTTSVSHIDLQKLMATELAELEEEIGYFATTVLKNAFRKKIQKRLSRTSCFSAVKRTFIKDRHPEFIDLFD